MFSLDGVEVSVFILSLIHVGVLLIKKVETADKDLWVICDLLHR